MGETVLASQPVRRRRNLLITAAASLGLLVAYNGVVAVPAMNALADEDAASIAVYRRWLISPSQIVIDVRDLGDEARIIDVDRMLFKTAAALKDRKYDKVVLASNGTARFVLDGAHFKTVGEEWPDQNPIYTIRTIQEHIYNLDGTEAFGTWTGGWIGVLGKQMEDHNELHTRWYLRDQAGLPIDAPTGPSVLISAES